MGLTKPRAAQIYNLDYKQATRVVTVANITLTGGAPAVVDGVSLSTNDRVLVTGQSTASQNGLYYVSTLGSGNNGTWSRTSDGNETGEIDAGMIVMVTEGSTYADTQWKLITDNPITIGSTALVFTQNYYANSINSGSSNVTVYSNANVTMSSAGTANVLAVSSTGTVTSGTASVSGNVTGGNVLTGGLISATGNVTGNYILGNGALLTGVITSVANINNGTSNVTVVSSGGNVTVGIGGTSNVAVFATSGEYVTGVISASGNVTGGNILTSGLISATGNVTVGNISATIGAFTTFTSAQGGNVTGTLIATSSNAQFFNQTNGAGYFTVAGYLSAVGNVTGGNLITAAAVSAASVSASGNVTGGNILTGGLISSTGNITGNYILGNGSQLTGLPATYSNTNVSSFLAAFGSNTISTTGTVTAGNITGGNILTVGQVSATGTITTAGGTNSTGFAVGNGAVSNVGLGFFPTAGTRGDYAIRDYSSVFSTMYLDVGMGSSAGGEFQFRSSNAFSLVMRANSSGVYTPGIMSATGSVYGLELWSTNSVGSEGGQINLALPASGSTISGGVIIDVYNNLLRFYERSGTNRGAYIDLTATSAAVGTNLLASGGGGTPGGSNTYVQFNDGGAFGGNGQFVYNKTTNTLTVGNVAANANGQGTNFIVGDDGYIGDINTADTIGIKGQQNGANGYIVFGNADSTSKLGRAGSGPLTYAGAFSATANVTGGNILTGGLISATGNIIGNRIAVAAGTAAAPSVQFSNDISADTGFYWVSDGNIGVTTNGTLRATFLDTGVSVVGNVTGGNVLTGGLISATANVTGGNVLTGGLISATANVTGGNVLTGGLISATSTITSAANVIGGNLTTAGQVSATANITGGNILTGGLISATANITGGNLNAAGLSLSGNVVSALNSTANITTTANISGGFILGNGSQLTGITGTYGNANVATFLAAFGSNTISTTGNITSGNLIQGGVRVFKWTTSETAPVGPVPGDQWFIASTGKRYEYWNDGTGNAWVDQSQSTSFDALAVSGAATISGSLTVGTLAIANITNSGANGVGNIGNSTGYFNTIFAKATSAQYADLAEKYIADAEYPSGTVVIFGGDQEITVSNISHDTRLAGVVSTNPAYLMNSGEQGLPVALTGRVPCQVRGPVQKGDVLVNVEQGIAGRLDPSKATWGCVLGKSLENYSGNSIALIEIAVGRF